MCFFSCSGKCIRINISLCSGLSKFNTYPFIDIIIVARGGGSFEDLNTFNDEKLVRVIFNSKKPVITAIGHETDFTISDFVADLRASTPSVAAQISTQFSKDLIIRIDNCKNSINHSIEKKIEFYNNENKHLKSHLSIENLTALIGKLMNEKRNLDKILSINIKNRLNFLSKILSQYNKRLNNNNLTNILKKGFALILDKKGNVIQKSKNIKLKDNIYVNFSDGKVEAKIIGKK